MEEITNLIKNILKITELCTDEVNIRQVIQKLKSQVEDDEKTLRELDESDSIIISKINELSLNKCDSKELTREKGLFDINRLDRARLTDMKYSEMDVKIMFLKLLRE